MCSESEWLAPKRCRQLDSSFIDRPAGGWQVEYVFGTAKPQDYGFVRTVTSIAEALDLLPALIDSAHPVVG